MNRGLLIVLEGVNGAGKTSIIAELIEYYTRIGVKVSSYKFPDRSGLYGDKIDRYLKGTLVIDSKYEVLNMFAANRRVHSSSIRKDLHDGKLVFVDRYVFSGIAYQIPDSVFDSNRIRRYCSVFGHFDNHMSFPNVVYLIEGNHLIKRGIARREVFHDVSKRRLYDRHAMIHQVISNFRLPCVSISNRDGHLRDAVQQIIYDVNIRRY